MNTKNLFLAIMLTTAIFTGCTTPQKRVSLTDKNFELVTVGHSRTKYKKVHYQFKKDRLEIFSITDLKRLAGDVTITPYSFVNNRLKIFSKNFDAQETKKGYDLYQNGILKYRLLSNPTL